MLPGPPWSMEGETVVAFMGGGSVTGPLPPGLHALPGPGVLVAERHADSPAGPFLTMVLGRPARVGTHVGLCFTSAGVSRSESRSAGRLHWGFPGEPATIDWREDGDDIVVGWQERDILVRAHFPGRALPLSIPFRAIQVKSEGPAIVPGRLSGRFRRGRADVTGDGLAGRRRALHVAGMRLVLQPARFPSRRLARLRAPAPGAEPGYSFRPAPSRGSRAPVG
jgi:hypothetical protein